MHPKEILENLNQLLLRREEPPESESAAWGRAQSGGEASNRNVWGGGTGMWGGDEASFQIHVSDEKRDERRGACSHWRYNTVQHSAVFRLLTEL